MGPQEDDVGGELEKIGRVIGAQRRFVGRKRPGDGLDLAQLAAGELVDASGEREGPAAVHQTAFDGQLESGAGILGLSTGAQLVMPVLAQLGAPEALGAAARFLRPDGEIGEFAHAEGGGPLFEGELHGVRGRPMDSPLPAG
ncbi:MAG: hypothetical protein ACHQ5A_08965 [Opitutales bacterium]